MREALGLAHLAASHGDVPVGAVVVVHDRIVGRGENRRQVDRDPLAHAELVALRDASQNLGNWRFDEATLVVTLEPCVMCAGAIVQTRVAHVVYGASDAKAGGGHSLYQLLEDPRLPHRTRVTRGILEQPCADVLHQFFAGLRNTGR